jgi:hypothetical protein
MEKVAAEMLMHKDILVEITAEKDGMKQVTEKEMMAKLDVKNGRKFEEEDPYAKLKPLNPALAGADPILQSPSNYQFTKMLMFRVKYWDERRDIFWYAGKFYANSLASAYN